MTPPGIVHIPISHSYLGVCYGQCIHPDPPASPFIFDGMVQKDPKYVVHHLSYFLLFWVLWVDVSEGEHPVLPHRALQQTAVAQHKEDVRDGLQREFNFKIQAICMLLPAVLAAVAEEFYHVRKEKSPDFHQLRTGTGVLQQGGHHFQNHWV